MSASFVSPRVRRLVLVTLVVAAGLLAVLPYASALILRWYLGLGTEFDAVIPLPPQVTVAFSHRIDIFFIGIAGVALAGAALAHRRRTRRDAGSHR